MALGYASGIISGKAGEAIVSRLKGLLARGASPPPGAGGRIELVPRVWYNPDLLSRWFYLPAVLAMILMMMTMMLSAMGVVREKEIGTMEQLMVTPIRSWQLLVGKLFPFAVIGFIQTLLVTAVTVWGFQVRLAGSLPLLLGLTMLFILSTLGLGLLVSTIVENQQQAMMGAAFVLMIPMIYLSGLLFPIENMPRAIQYVTYAIPRALLRRDPARHLPAGLGHGRPVAPGPGAAGDGRCDHDRRRLAVPQAAGLTRSVDQAGRPFVTPAAWVAPGRRRSTKTSR